MNVCLLAEFGVYLLQRHAIGDLAARAAILAHILVHDGELGWRRQLAALLLSPPLVGALAIVDDDRDPIHGFEFLEHRLHVARLANDGVRRKVNRAIGTAILRNDSDTHDSVGCKKLRDLRDRTGGY
jgi:hypothetical protein